MTRGIAGSRRWHWSRCDDERRRSTAWASSRAVCRSGEKQAQGREAAGQRLGDTWTGAERCWGGRGGAHGRDNGGDARQRKTEERGREVDEEGPGCNFQKR
jgi:hypothetical protein